MSILSYILLNGTFELHFSFSKTVHWSLKSHEWISDLKYTSTRPIKYLSTKLIVRWYSVLRYFIIKQFHFIEDIETFNIVYQKSDTINSTCIDLVKFQDFLKLV